MIRLTKALSAWGTPEFPDAFKREIEQLDAGQLPLQQGLSTTSHVADKPFSVMILGASEAAGVIHARVGIFYAGIIAGCSCADDPTPVEAQSEYCVVRFEIDRRTGETTVTLVDEQ
jgi:hypothetical protein